MASCLLPTLAATLHADEGTLRSFKNLSEGKCYSAVWEAVDFRIAVVSFVEEANGQRRRSCSDVLSEVKKRVPGNRNRCKETPVAELSPSAKILGVELSSMFGVVYRDLPRPHEPVPEIIKHKKLVELFSELRDYSVKVSETLCNIHVSSGDGVSSSSDKIYRKALRKFDLEAKRLRSRSISQEKALTSRLQSAH